nr:unnamed protein product [Digitaria exilis]
MGMARQDRLVAAMLALAVCLLLPVAARAQLRVGFYDTTCPNAEALVRQAVAAAFAKDAGIAAGLIRLHFHDCFVRGCDGSVLLSVNPGGGQTERDAAPNNPSLRGFDVIDAAKAAVESSCPGTVSCADIVAFAARDSIGLTGSVSYQVPAGRRDGRVSNASDTIDLPPPTSTAKNLTDLFAAKNLSVEDMVVLSGAHTVGRSFCNSFTTPITTAMDPGTPNVLDNNYYKLLPRGMGLFFSDNQLRVDTQMAALVAAFAANETLWKEKFAAAMVKMGRIQVQTGTCGEVRLNCSVVNPTSSAATIELLGSSAPAADEDGNGIAAS